MTYSASTFVFLWYITVFDYCIINNLELNSPRNAAAIDEKINGSFENKNGVNIYLNDHFDKLFKFANFQLL